MTKAQAIAAFNAVCTAHTDATRTVVNGASTATGFMGSLFGQSDLGAAGQMGPRDGTVYVSADVIGTVKHGGEIRVGDDWVTVQSTQIDPLGALNKIGYRITRPVIAEAI
jgi:hypothetical protein